ncbi:MAG: DEAD/DEAH box helicase [bacterium]|jgi:DEAD/DEAH box helicase domain-containing protein
MDSALLLGKIRRHPRYRDQIVHIEHLSPQAAEYGTLTRPLAGLLERHLREKGIERLYVHQTEAVDAVRRGEHIVTVTPTASGKTMCYNLPVLDGLLAAPEGRALYIFPTKALSRDQYDSICSFGTPLAAAVYDGDTPDQTKALLRENANIIITNPDMLHMGILANHLKWHSFFANLRYVVIDEIHSYRGVFGTHVGHVLRRLRRICRHYGASPAFVLSSATIANPGEHAERLVGLPVRVIDNNGAPRGESHFVLWRQPERTSLVSEVAWLFAALLRGQARTIAFSRARQATERILRQTRRELEGTSLAEKVLAYRGGYLAKERRQIEAALFQGQARGVVSTNALELGIDVGDLDVCVIAGFPGTIASTWQQAGRVGRRQRDSLIFFIAVTNPLDQYFLRHTEALFRRPTEEALIDPENPYILLSHALCLAHELPVTEADFAFWSGTLRDLLVILADDGLVAAAGGKIYYSGQGFPADKVNIRTASAGTFQLRDAGDAGRLIGVIDGAAAYSETHPGAVYMHQGETYVVRELDTEKTTVRLDKAEVDYYTVVKRDKKTEILATREEKEMFGNRVGLGELKVTTKVTGFVKKHELSGQVLGGGTLSLPEQVLETIGMWLTVNEEIETKVKEAGRNLMGGIHAIEHAAIGLLPLFVMCDRNDIGGLSVLAHSQTGRPTVFIHDAYNGGVGFSEKAYRDIERLLLTTLEAVRECACDSGCPSCIYSPKCSNFNQPLDKEAAIMLLHYLLGQEYTPRPAVVQRQNLVPLLRRMKQ